jgi:hypothetical protein
MNSRMSWMQDIGPGRPRSEHRGMKAIVPRSGQSGLNYSNNVEQIIIIPTGLSRFIFTPAFDIL